MKKSTGLTILLFALLTAGVLTEFPATALTSSEEPGLNAGHEIDASRLPRRFLIKNENGLVYCSLTVFIDVLKFTDVRYEKESRSLLLTGPRTVRLRVGDRWFELDGSHIQMSAPVLLVNKEIFLPARDFSTALGCRLTIPEEQYVNPLDREDENRISHVRGRDREPELTQGMFFRRLLQKREATREDVCRATAILLKLPEALGPFEDLLAALETNKLIPGSWEVPRDDPATRGFACYLFVKALGRRGGLSTRLFGLSGRTAYREAINLRLTAPSGDRTKLTGGELMTMLQQASKLKRGY